MRYVTDSMSIILLLSLFRFFQNVPLRPRDALQNCCSLVKTVEETGAIMREIRDLEDQVYESGD